MPEKYWTLQEAGDEVGLTAEGVRLWTKGQPPRIRSKRVRQGRRERVLVHRGDVLREAELTPEWKVGRPPRRKKSTAGTGADGELRDRVALLEEVVRRQRIINEQQEEIAERYREISRQHSEVEELLLAPSWVPDP